MTRGERCLPNRVQTEFLRACLLEGAAGRQAVATWLEAVGDPIAGLRREQCADRNLFALLQQARGGGRVSPSPDPPRSDPLPADTVAPGATPPTSLPPAVASILRAAAVHEELRAESIGAAAGDVLAALAAAGIEPLVIGGAALAWGSYPAPSLRHCHNVDLLVADPGGARAVLSGLEPLAGAAVAATGSLHLRHPSGTLFALHAKLYRERWRRSPGDLGVHAADIVLGGQPARVAGAADLFVATSANAFGLPRPRMRFYADGWMLATRGAVDWERVVAHAIAARQAVPTATLLGWLEATGGLAAGQVPVTRLRRARAQEAAVVLAVGGLRRVRSVAARLPLGL